MSLADVESANIVGYHTVNINKEYTLLSVGFDAVDGKSLTIQQAFPYCDGMTKGQSDSEGDNIQIMTEAGGYDIYFLSNGHYGKGGASYDANLDGKWAKMGTATVSDTTLPAGITFFYLSRGAGTAPYDITVAGAVHSAASTDFTINKAYTLIGSPYPCDIPLNGGIEVTGATKGQSDSEGDNIQIMTEAGGYDIYFLSNGHYGKGGASYDANLDGKWAKMGTATVTTDTLPAGKGAFYLSRSSEGTLKFLSPIKKDEE